jgi:hypothetical protein
MDTQCLECGAALPEGVTCRDHFDQMLYWEAENSANWAVHHLMVLCYHLQHPSLYSPEMLNGGMGLLADFVERGITTEQVRKRDRDKVDSGKRTWKIKGTPESHGVYKHPITWTMTAADVTGAGEPNYCDSVRAWSQSMLEALRLSGNFPAE